MDLGTLYVKLDMLTADFDRKLTRSEQRLERFEKRTKQTGQRMIEIGSKLAAGITLPLGLATYQAGRFEQSMLDLQKVTDKMTMENLRRPLLEMSETIPESASDLARLATQAGRFGVQGSKNIQKFTKTTAQMATATDLTAEDAGKNLAKIAEMTETPVDEIHNLGSAVVQLGNNFATAESEIVKASMRGASALRDMGASQQEIMGLSASLNEVFPSARRAGTGLRRVAQQLTDPQQARDVADIMGIQVERFREMRENAPVQTLLKLSQALQRGGERGRELRDTFTSVVRKTLTNMAGNMDGVREAVAMANKEYDRNTALTREFGIQSKGMLNQLKNLWDSIKNVGTAIGQITMPAVKDITTAFQSMLNTVESLISAFNKLPGVLKTPLSYLTTMSMLAPVGLMGAGLATKGAGMVAGTMRAGMGQLRKAGTWLNQPAAMGVMAGAGGRGRHRMRRPQMPDRGTQLKTQARAKLSKLKSTFTGVAAGEGIRRIVKAVKDLKSTKVGGFIGRVASAVKNLITKLGGLRGIAGKTIAVFLGFQVLKAHKKTLKDMTPVISRDVELFKEWVKSIKWLNKALKKFSQIMKGAWSYIKLFPKALNKLYILFSAVTKRTYNFVSSFILLEYYVLRGVTSINSLHIAFLRLRKLGKKPFTFLPFVSNQIDKINKKIAELQKKGPDFFGKAGQAWDKQKAFGKTLEDMIMKSEGVYGPIKKLIEESMKKGEDAMDKQADSAERIQMALQSASQAWEDMFRATLQGAGKDSLTALANNVARTRGLSRNTSTGSGRQGTIPKYSRRKNQEQTDPLSSFMFDQLQPIGDTLKDVTKTQSKQEKRERRESVKEMPPTKMVDTYMEPEGHVPAGP